MPREQSISILLADEQEIFRAGLCRLLETFLPTAQVVAQAGNGRDLVRLNSELSPDLVILDLTMPELNGVDAIRQMRQDVSNLRVVILSMQIDPQSVDEALKNGAAGYVLKNSSVDELKAAILAVIEGKTYLCSPIAELLVRQHIRGEKSTNGSTDNAFSGLSVREREVLQLLAEGQSSKEIGSALFIGLKTVETHRSQIMKKLNIRSIAALTKYAIRCGLTSL